MCSNQLSYSGFFENPGLPLFSECKYIAFFYSCKICPRFFCKNLVSLRRINRITRCFRKTYQLTFVLILNALSCLAQSGLVFDRPAWDFGTIRETDGPVTHRFVCRNEGGTPRSDPPVTTTCGCTTPRYTRKPILPGEEAEITVTYDPANRPGNFSRKLAVFTADRRIGRQTAHYGFRHRSSEDPRRALSHRLRRRTATRRQFSRFHLYL